MVDNEQPKPNTEQVLGLLEKKMNEKPPHKALA
jgi:hypothetical protein